MADLSSLKTSAEVSANRRGHKLIWYAPWHGEFASNRMGSCERCNMAVSITTRPAANEIDIGGEAVALNCSQFPA